MRADRLCRLQECATAYRSPTGVTALVSSTGGLFLECCPRFFSCVYLQADLEPHAPTPTSPLPPKTQLFCTSLHPHTPSSSPSGGHASKVVCHMHAWTHLTHSHSPINSPPSLPPTLRPLTVPPPRQVAMRPRLCVTCCVTTWPVSGHVASRSRARLTWSHPA